MAHGWVEACATCKREVAGSSRHLGLIVLRRCAPGQGTLPTRALSRPRSKWVPSRTGNACVLNRFWNGSQCCMLRGELRWPYEWIGPVTWEYSCVHEFGWVALCAIHQTINLHLYLYLYPLRLEANELRVSFHVNIVLRVSPPFQAFTVLRMSLEETLPVHT